MNEYITQLNSYNPISDDKLIEFIIKNIWVPDDMVKFIVDNYFNENMLRQIITFCRKLDIFF